MSVRFVFAIVSLVLAALAIGLGIAQRTVFALPDSVSTNITTETNAPATIIPGEVLNANPRSQTITIAGDGTVFAAYGRTTDVEAFVGEASHNTLGIDPDTGKFTNTLTSGEASLPSAAGSDLWLLDFSDENDLTITINVPEDVSLLIMSDGTAPAPSQVGIVWPLDNSTPWAIPLVIAGGGFLLLGLALLFWAVTHMHSARGPRRKSQKMPKLPRQPRYKPSRVRPKALESPSRGRRSIRPSVVAVLPLTLVGALVLGGCSPDFLAGRTPAEDSSASAGAPTADAAGEELEAPAVTEQQAKRIIARVSAIVTQADDEADMELAATRLAGPALELRLANYKMRKADKTIKPLAQIPAGPVKLTLPQQRDTWPRTVFAAILDDDPTVPSVALVLIQQSAREQYMVHYAITMEPGAVIPPVAQASVGTSRIGADVPLLTVVAGEVAMAYGDVLMLGEKSEYFDLFEAEGDSLRLDVGVEAKTTRKKKIPSTAKLSFENVTGTGEAVALSTNDLGALVAVNLNEIETIRVVEAGAAVNAPKQVKALLGKSLSTKGLNAVYGDQLLFYVPQVGSDEKIVLLGYSQGIIAASEYKKKKK
jgi:hypothetical protein